MFREAFKKKYREKSENGTISLYTPPSPPIKWKTIKWIIEQNVDTPPPHKKVKILCKHYDVFNLFNNKKKTHIDIKVGHTKKLWARI